MLRRHRGGAGTPPKYTSSTSAPLAPYRYGTVAGSSQRQTTRSAGAPADLIVWRCEEPAAVPYRYGAAAQLIERVYIAGAPVPA